MRSYCFVILTFYFVLYLDNFPIFLSFLNLKIFQKLFKWNDFSYTFCFYDKVLKWVISFFKAKGNDLGKEAIANQQS